MSEPFQDPIPQPHDGDGPRFLVREKGGNQSFGVEPHECISYGPWAHYDDFTDFIYSEWVLHLRGQFWIKVFAQQSIYIDDCNCVQGEYAPISAQEALQWILANGIEVPADLEPLRDQQSLFRQLRTSVPEAVEVTEVTPEVTEVTPERPTPEYCAIRPKIIRWKGTVEVEPRFVRLLDLLLKQCGNQTPVTFDEAMQVLSRQGEARPKTVSNTLSALNDYLLQVDFPWGYRVSDQHILIENRGP